MCDDIEAASLRVDHDPQLLGQLSAECRSNILTTLDMASWEAQFTVVIARSCPPHQQDAVSVAEDAVHSNSGSESLGWHKCTVLTERPTPSIQLRASSVLRR